MKILVACEWSGVVRDAFIRRGHDAVSCDLIPSESSFGPHIVGDVIPILGGGWDMMIAFPPCTYLCSSGIHRNCGSTKRMIQTEAAIRFVKTLMGAPIEKIAVENPVGVLSSRIRKPDQIIQPWMFGEDAQKATCLWLKNLPKLTPTKVVRKHRYSNQTESGQNRLPPSKDRAKIRGKTYFGVGEAMASQWGDQ